MRTALGRTCRLALTGEHGTALPPFFDHHVHAHLVDLDAVGGIAGVLDLGGDPAALAQRGAAALPRVSFAGAFLTAPGGYPSDRAWAPPVAVREVAGARALGDPAGAQTAVDEQALFGASVIKVALNARAGAVFDANTLTAIVTQAHEHRLPVVAHVEGEWMTRLAVDAGVDALAHIPFTERIDAALLEACAGMVWITTLAIHEGRDAARAIANVTAFADAGGRVLYGTDLGNGDLPRGVNARELDRMRAAGLDGAALIAALTDPWPHAGAREAHVEGLATFLPGPRPTEADGLPAWLATARTVPKEELLYDEP